MGMARREGTDSLQPMLSQTAASFGYQLVDVELVKEGPGRYLRIYIDKPGGITLDDCETYHRTIQAKVEHVDYDFLEVCSPGVDRPLKTEADWTRALGGEIAVRLYRAEAGAKEHVGFLRTVEKDAVVLETAAGEVRLMRKAIAQAKPVVRFEDEEEETP